MYKYNPFEVSAAPSGFNNVCATSLVGSLAQ